MSKKVIRITCITFFCICVTLGVLYGIGRTLWNLSEAIRVETYKGDTDAVVKVVESVFGINLPESTDVLKINATDDTDGQFMNAFIEFDAKDIEVILKTGLLQTVPEEEMHIFLDKITHETIPFMGHLERRLGFLVDSCNKVNLVVPEKVIFSNYTANSSCLYFDRGFIWQFKM